jgi:UDP-glucuronate decarboxylase
MPASCKRILVTGGAGFIGSHLTKTLLNAGHRVWVVDDFSSGRKGSLGDLEDDNSLEVIEHDVVHPIFLQVDEIYHLACPASPTFYQRDPVQTMKTCLQGSINMLELAKEVGSPILLASTSEVYGDPAVHPQDENYWGNVNPIGARACYDEGKRAAEALFFSYRSQYQVAVKVARIFNTYGPNMSPEDGRVVSNFIMQSLRGEPLKVLGDGSQTRSFCYVSDLIPALIALMGSSRDVTGPINIGNPEETTVSELAALIGKLVGGGVGVEYGSLPDDDPRRRKPSIDRARDLLGWEPSTPLAVGIASTVEYFRSQMD